MTREEIRGYATEHTSGSVSNFSIDIGMGFRIVWAIFFPFTFLFAAIAWGLMPVIHKICIKSYNPKADKIFKFKDSVWIWVAAWIVILAIVLAVIIATGGWTHEHGVWLTILVFYLEINAIIGCLYFMCIIFIDCSLEKKEVALDQKILSQVAKQQTPVIKYQPLMRFWKFLFQYQAFYRCLETNIEAEHKQNHPYKWSEGMLINKNERLLVPLESWNTHFLFIGASGFGKTYNILRLIFAALYNDFPTIILDGKGDPELEKELTRICCIHKCKLGVWNWQNNLKYNPFAQKTEEELINMICELFDYSAKKQNPTTNIYAGYTKQCISVLVRFLMLKFGKVNFPLLTKYSEPGKIDRTSRGSQSSAKWVQTPIYKEMGELVKAHPNNLEYKDLYQDIKKINLEQLAIVNSDMAEIAYNVRNIIGDDGICLKDILKANTEGNNCILFQLRYNLTNSFVSKMLLFEIDLLADYNEQQRAIDHKKTLLVVDESQVVFQSQLQASSMIQQYRSKQICLAFGFQEKAGIESANKTGLLSSLINNCGTFFVSRLRDESTIKAVSSIHGTQKHLMPTIQTTIDENGKYGAQGMGSLRMDEEYVWHPNDIRKLQVGQVMFSTQISEKDENGKNQKVDIIKNNLYIDNIVDLINKIWVEIPEAQKQIQTITSTNNSGKTIEKVENNSGKKVEKSSNDILSQAIRDQEWKECLANPWLMELAKNSIKDKEVVIPSDGSTPDWFLKYQSKYKRWIYTKEQLKNINEMSESTFQNYRKQIWNKQNPNKEIPNDFLPDKIAAIKAIK